MSLAGEYTYTLVLPQTAESQPPTRYSLSPNTAYAAAANALGMLAPVDQVLDAGS